MEEKTQNKVFRIDSFEIPKEKPVSICMECENISVYYCKRCDINVCEFHISTHLDSRMCNACGKDTCLEMICNDIIDDREFPEDLCFRCRMKGQMHILRDEGRKILSQSEHLTVTMGVELSPDQRSVRCLQINENQKQKLLDLKGWTDTFDEVLKRTNYFGTSSKI